MFDIILGILILASSLLTIFAANSIYGALQLIVTYCLVGVLLLVYDIEFFAITYIIVCAGGMGSFCSFSRTFRQVLALLDGQITPSAFYERRCLSRILARYARPRRSPSRRGLGDL